VYTPNDPIIESSTNLTFAPYNLRYPFLKEHSESACITGQFIDDDNITVTKTNHWNSIFDFTKKEVPNYNLLNAQEFKIDQAQQLLNKTIEGKGSDPDFLFELPLEYGGTLDKSQ
jgi:hypothetical protein